MPFIPPMELIAEKCGYVVLKDSKVALFYTNDLSTTPSSPILYSSDEEAITAVNDLGVIRRWHGNEVLHHTEMQVPAIIVADNYFMNSTDRMDQIRSTAPTWRKERRLPMTLFTFVLDPVVDNTRSILSKLDPTSTTAQ